MLSSRAVGEDLARGEDGVVRCAHDVDVPAFRAYHDDLFGRPSADDRWIFEKVALEVFAAGLSFTTALAGRDRLRAAFDGFDLATVAGYGNVDVERLMSADGVVHNRRKIQAVVTDAGRALELVEEAGSLAAFLWGFEAPADARPERVDTAYLRQHTSTPQSAAMAKALKQRGWSFVGPVVAYGVMQGTGVVNDHVTGCDLREECRRDRAAFTPPVRGPA